METLLPLAVGLLSLIIGCVIFYLGIRVGLSIKITEKEKTERTKRQKNVTVATSSIKEKPKKTVYLTQEHEEKIQSNIDFEGEEI